MKIVTWNCSGALRKKFQYLDALKADIYVIQECEDPKKVQDTKYIKWAQNYLWIGDKKSRGIGIFANEKIKLEKLDWPDLFDDHKVKYFLPCKVNNSFQLLGVWTHKNNSPNFGYIGQFWKYLQLNKKYFNRMIICGDFNSNKIWDEWDRWWNHSNVVSELEKMNITSLYHFFHNEKQGEETHPTFFHRSNKKSYHIDYFFSEINITKVIKKFLIEEKGDWRSISDHLPIIIEF